MEIEIRRAEVADAEAGAGVTWPAGRRRTPTWWTLSGCARRRVTSIGGPSAGRARSRRRTALDRAQPRSGCPDPGPGDRVFFAGPARDEDAPTPLELGAIYVRAKWWGSGLGDRLLDVAIGKEPASLWLLEGNGRAKAFYRRHGFVEDGSRMDEEFFGVPEIRMVRPAR